METTDPKLLARDSPGYRSHPLCESITQVLTSAPLDYLKDTTFNSSEVWERTSVRVEFAALIARHDLHLCASSEIRFKPTCQRERDAPKVDKLQRPKDFAHLGKVARSCDLDVAVRLDEVYRAGRMSSVASTDSIERREHSRADLSAPAGIKRAPWPALVHHDTS